jgi:deoxyadenosine/deoxycytidine kinase
MGNLIIIVGNTGVGKSTLTRLLGEQVGFTTGMEEHSERPFQILFKHNCKYALANQIDYLLLRAEQEQNIRSGGLTGVLDGGMEMDFHIFSRLFQMRGWLDEPEFALLDRMYTAFRELLPPPEIVICMLAKPEIIAERFSRRGRPFEIAELSDLQTIDVLLTEWLVHVPQNRLISVDASGNDPGYQKVLPVLREKVMDILGDKKG